MKTKSFLSLLFCSLCTLQLTAQLTAINLQSVNGNPLSSSANFLRMDFEENPVVNNLTTFVIEVVNDPNHPANGTWDIEGHKSTYTLTLIGQTSGFWDFVADTHLFVHLFDQSFEFNAPLPVDLISFTGSTKDNQVILQWESAQETNFDRYELQATAKGADLFQTLAQIPGTGYPGIYHYIDSRSTTGLYYYRLKMIDWDGSFSYSDILPITKPNGKAVKAYPTVTNGKIYFDLDEPKIFTLYSGSGQKIVEGLLNNELDLNHLIPGFYCLRIEDQKPLILFLKR